MFENNFPIGGAWIQIIKKIPVKNPLVQPLSIHFAMIHKIHFEQDMIPWSFATIPAELMKGKFASKEAFIKKLHKFETGNRSKLDSDEIRHIEESKEYCEKNDIDLSMCFTVKIVTPDGDSYITANEYTIVDIEKYVQMADGEHIIMNFFEGDIKFAGKMKDIIFYMRSRGIGLHESIKMLSRDVKKHSIFWINFHEEYQRHFGLI